MLSRPAAVLVPSIESALFALYFANQGAPFKRESRNHEITDGNV